MLKTSFYVVLLITSSFSFSNELTKSSDIVAPFKAHYNILRKSDIVGTGVRELSSHDNGQFIYSYATNIDWLIFSDSRKETSILSINQNTIVPDTYEFTREGTGKDKHYFWQFDIENNLAKNLLRKKNKTVEFPNTIQDKLSYHLQLRHDLIANPDQRHFVYPVISTSAKIKNYVYQYDGTEELMLPIGMVKAIKLKREVIEKKRVTYAWFAPELNYLMVKLHQRKDGIEQFEAQLTKVENKLTQ